MGVKCRIILYVYALSPVGEAVLWKGRGDGAKGEKRQVKKIREGRNVSRLITRTVGRAHRQRDVGVCPCPWHLGSECQESARAYNGIPRESYVFLVTGVSLVQHLQCRCWSWPPVEGLRSTNACYKHPLRLQPPQHTAQVRDFALDMLGGQTVQFGTEGVRHSTTRGQRRVESNALAVVFHGRATIHRLTPWSRYQHLF